MYVNTTNTYRVVKQIDHHGTLFGRWYNKIYIGNVGTTFCTLMTRMITNLTSVQTVKVLCMSEN